MTAALVLASSSPRRRDLLTLAGVTFRSAPPDVDETPRAGEQPARYVERVARAKAQAVAAAPDDVVLAADTTVALGSTIYGKPADVADARRMLRELSGRTHEVLTAVAVRTGGNVATAVVATAVTLIDIPPGELEWYVSTGEPLDKAGAYALQGAGGAFVAAVAGSVSNVVGLPMTTVVDLLAAAGRPLAAFRARRGH
jgi:septum formation protein